MSTFEIVFLDGEKRIVNAFNFSCAKTIAAYSRMKSENAQTHKSLTPNDDLCHIMIPMILREKADAQTDLAV